MRLSKNILEKKMWNLKQQYGQHQYKVFETLHFRKIKFSVCVRFGMEGMGALGSLLLVQPQIGHKRWSYRSRFLPSLDDNSDKQKKKEKSFCENTGIIVFYFPYFCHHHFSSRTRFLLLAQKSFFFYILQNADIKHVSYKQKESPNRETFSLDHCCCGTVLASFH